jgi:DNA-binding NtrC family response regulator
MTRLRAGEKSLSQLLAAASRAIYAIDGQHQLVYCNAACGELLGIDPAALIGQPCKYHTPDGGAEPARIAASLCPPPEAWHGEITSAVLTVRQGSGAWQPYRAEFMLLGGEGLLGGGLVATLAPCVEPADRASESVTLHAELARLHQDLWEHWPLEELVGVSPAIQRVRDQLVLAARGAVRVLIQGATGSGREHAARLLYRRSLPTGSEPLIPLWCPLLDAELIQSTITAVVRQWGLAPPAAAGSEPAAGLRAPTLLLLEVDQLTREAQTELAGFLALPSFECYTIATSQASLLQLAAADQYRKDLAFALSTLVIDIPPLAARPEDVPLLSQHFVEKYNRQGKRQLSGLVSEALDALALYPWPENVAELAEVVARSCQAAEGSWIEPRHLPDKIRWANQTVAHPPRDDEAVVLDAVLEEVERELFVRALRRAKGNKTKAARLLGLTRARFHRRWEYFQRSLRGDAGTAGNP